MSSTCKGPRTYALVDEVPDLVTGLIVCPVLHVSMSDYATERLLNILHLECEGRGENDSQHALVSPEESAKRY